MSYEDTYKYPKIESNKFFISPNSTVILSSDAVAYLNRANYSEYLTRAQAKFCFMKFKMVIFWRGL